MSLFDIENQNDEISEKKTPSASKETKKNMNTYNTMEDGIHTNTLTYLHTHTHLHAYIIIGLTLHVLLTRKCVTLNQICLVGVF